MTEIHGKCSKKFIELKSVFQKNFLGKDDIGASVCVFYKGKKVVDLWGGFRNQDAKLLWEQDTIVPLFSVTKGLTSICYLMLAVQKKLDYNLPVTYYWKEFGRNGKAHITVRELLEHRAGLHILDQSLSLEDFYKDSPKIYQALINQKVRWNSADNQAYGAQAWGIYAAELFRRIQGESLGKFFYREITNKLKLNLYIGLPKDNTSSIAKIYPISNLDRITSLLPHLWKQDSSEGRTIRSILTGDQETLRAYLNPWSGLKGIEVFNDRRLQESELLWCSAMGDARSLAELYNVFILDGKSKGVKIANSKLMNVLKERNLLRYDKVIHKKQGWNLGFQKEEEGIFSPNYETFGHNGMGGSLAFVDPKARISFGYICNKLDYQNRPTKTLNLCKAVYDCLR